MNSRSVQDHYALFATACDIRRRWFRNQVFVYGFVYFSTYCRNHCRFCFYRKPNTKCPRYRKDPQEVLENARLLKQSGVHLIDLTMGEDPLIHNEKRYDLLVDIVRMVKDEVGLPVMVSPGVIPRSVLKALADVGADWYALYQETHNRELYSQLRVGQDYDDRMNTKTWAKKEGMLIEEGILIGVREDVKDRVDSAFAMKKIGPHQVRAMGFIPQPGSPMENQPSPPILDEMKIMAVLRLIHQDRLMPASYDIDGIKGLELRIMSGANVVTSLIPPKSGLAGVAQAHLDVNEGLRSVEGIRPFIERLGLRIASGKTYAKWVEREKELLKRGKVN